MRPRLTATARAGLTAATAIPAAEDLVTRLEWRLRRTDDALAVLTWHRVDRPAVRPWLYPGLISATPERFARQVEWLARRFRVLSVDDVLAARRRRRLPRRALLLTFDDGYADFAEHAWPILRAAGLPATLFVATDGAGSAPLPFWWDRLHAALGTQDGGQEIRVLLNRLKDLPHDRLLATVDEIAGPPTAWPYSRATLDWDALRRLSTQGVTIAPHTRTHPLLTRVPPAVARAEIESSRGDLLAALPGADGRVFAYPSGRFDESVVGVVDDLGFELAFTTDRGLNRLGGAHRLRLRRFNVGGRSGPGALAAQLLAAEVAWPGEPAAPTDAF